MRQTPLSLYGKGVYKTKAGHLRYSSPAELRHQYVHRVKVEQLLKETPYSIQLLLPWPYEVHHMDWNKENNDPSNFLLVSESLHSCMTAARLRFKPKWQAPPQWLPLLDEEPPF